MNWKSLTLRNLGAKTALLGAAAGVLGGFLSEAATWLSQVWGAEIAGSGEPSSLTLSHLAAAAALGLGMGTLLAPVNDLLYGNRDRAWSSALLGGLSAALGCALVASLPAQSFLPEMQSLATFFGIRADGPWGAWPVLAMLLGVVAGVGGAVSGRGKRMLRRCVAGLVTGTVLGAGAAIGGALLPYQGWGFLGALALWGSLTALALFWWDKASARRWLRLLTPPGEDRIFPLRGQKLTLGTSEVNDIPLKYFREIYPYHCHVEWADNQYRIVDNERGGIVLVNYRQIEQQVLKAGDLIKIGSAVLQYGEAQ